MKATSRKSQPPLDRENEYPSKNTEIISFYLKPVRLMVGLGFLN